LPFSLELDAGWRECVVDKALAYSSAIRDVIYQRQGRVGSPPLRKLV